jgi:predicted nucleotidyltransferase
MSAPAPAIGGAPQPFERDKAVRLALAHLNKRYPRAAVIPFGSAAWGETTRTQVADWVSDIEIGIVGGIWLRVVARRASAFLSAVLDREVEVFWVRPSRLRRGRRRNFGPAFPNLHAFNLSRSEVLGDLPRRAQPVRVWSAADLRPSEGALLILNRVGESMSKGDFVYGDAKVAMSCGDAILIARAAYKPTYVDRFHALKTLLADEPALLGPRTDEVAATILWGYGYKVDGQGNAPRPTRQALRDAVLATIATITGADASSPSDVVARVERALTSSAVGERVSPLRTAIRGAYSVFRGRGRVDPRMGVRLIGREPLEVRVYVALLIAYLGLGDAERLGTIVPGLDSIAGGTDDEARHAAVVTLWRAYCY